MIDLICIKEYPPYGSPEQDSYFKVGEKYKALGNMHHLVKNESYYAFRIDWVEYIEIPICHFITLAEHREQQINSILNDTL